jgi:hypothetical protein
MAITVLPIVAWLFSRNFGGSVADGIAFSALLLLFIAAAEFFPN